MARMAKVLEEAERMLEEMGIEKVSIPAIAEATGVPRAAIYPFFPDKYALLSHLALTHMERLQQALATSESAPVEPPSEPARDWHAWISTAVHVTAAYYNAHRAASLLLLGGGFTDLDRAGHAAKNLSIGASLRARAARAGVLTRLPITPDAATLAIEIAFACMKHGYTEEGHISPAIRAEATRATIAYLSCWDDPKIPLK